MKEKMNPERGMQPVQTVQAVSVKNMAEYSASPINLDRLLILFQRRYNILRETRRITDDLAEATSRHDVVSTELELQMRRDQLQMLDNNWQEICLMGETDEAAGAEIQRLVLSDPTQLHSSIPKEERLYELRRTCRRLLKGIQQKDRVISLQAVHEKSVYFNKM